MATAKAASAFKGSTGVLDGIGEHLGTMVDAGRKLAAGRVLGALSSVILKGNPKGTLSYRSALQDRTADLLTASTPEAVQANMGALSSRATTDLAKSGALYRGAGKLANVGILQAAGVSTDPIPADNPDDREDPEYPTASADQAPLYRLRRR